MNAYHSLQALYYFGQTLFVAFILTLDVVMLQMARRKRLAAFVRFLVPAVVGAALAMALVLLDDVVLLFRLHRSGFMVWLAVVLGLTEGLFGAVSVFWLWRIVLGLRPSSEVTPSHSPFQGGEQSGVWPPPPTGAA